MNIFTSFYYVVKKKIVIGKTANIDWEEPESQQEYGKLDNEEFVKYLHDSLDLFLEKVKNNYDIQDVQTEFIVNLCVPNEEEEE